ncbi:MAG: prephenate dehydratase [Candidatus Gastranaerophilales bacterium]|nr:prephenate dehydratase [Candidatus Gastranaerophilales bacterium]
MSFLNSVQQIAYLGPGGSYTEMAKDIFCEKYKLNACQEPMKTIKRVLEFIDETPNAIGILPIENSIEGAVRETIDNLIRTKNPNIRILSEFVMPIRHCLLSRTTELYSITGVISHPQALAQCQNFIHNELPCNLDIIEVASTAEAAKSLENYNLTYAAIGSEKTGQIYNLNILKCNINDDIDNKTRFAIIGDFNTPKTNNDNTTLAFSTENKPGALLEILQIFHDYGINLSYIDSRPSKVKFGEYTFFVDFDGHITDEKILKLIKEIKSRTKYYRLVGSYERW